MIALILPKLVVFEHKLKTHAAGISHLQKSLYGTISPAGRKIFTMPPLGLDNRLRAFYFKLARFHECEAVAAAATEISPPSRCRRLVRADGTPFWAFDWQDSAQTFVHQADTSTPSGTSDPPSA